VSIQELSRANPGPTGSGFSRMALLPSPLESLRLVARLHVDLQRLASAICQY